MRLAGRCSRVNRHQDRAWRTFFVLATGFWGVPVFAQTELVSAEAPVVFEALLEDGEGFEAFTYLAETPGVLFLWAASDTADPSLLVATVAPGTGELGEFSDENGGGDTTAYVEVPVEAGQLVELVVCLSGEVASASSRLHVAQLISGGDAAEAALQTQLQAIAQTSGSSSAVNLDELVDQLLDATDRPESLEVLRGLEQVLALPASRLDPSLESRVRAAVLRHQMHHLPETHPALLQQKISLAIVLKNAGRREEALSLEQSVVDVRARILAEDDRALLLARLNLAATRYQLGQLEEASRAFSALNEQAARVLSPTDSLIPIIRQNLASTQLQRGYLEEAADTYKEVIETLTADPQRDPAVLALALQNLGQTLIRQDSPERAIPLLDEARALFQANLNEADPRIETADLHYAAGLKEIGDLAAARVIQERVLRAQIERLPADHLDLQTTKNTLAWTLSADGLQAEALTLWRDVVRVREAKLPASDPDLLSSRLSLATTLMDFGRVAEARGIFERVIEDAEPNYKPDDEILLRARWSLGWAHLESGEAEEALPELEFVSEAYEEKLPNDHLRVFEIRTDLAWALSLSGQAERAVVLLSDSIQATRRDLAARALRLGAREREALTAPLRRVVSECLSMAAEADWGGRGQELERELFGLIESIRSVSITQGELLRALEAGASDPEAARLLEEVRDADALVLRSAQGGAELFEAIRMRDAKERELHGHLADGVSQEGRGSASPASVASKLKTGQVAISFWRYGRAVIEDSGMGKAAEPHYLAYVLRSDGELRRVELGPARAIELAVEGWRIALPRGALRGVEIADTPVSATGADDEDTAGRALAALVFEPLREAIGAAELCHVSLDGVLHVLPFDALPWEGGVLGDRLRFVRCANLSAIGRPSTQTEAPVLLAMGGIDYDAVLEGQDALQLQLRDERPGAPNELFRSSFWSPSFAFLLGTEEEVAAIERTFDESFPDGKHEALGGRFATREIFEERAPESAYVHIATHAYFAPDSIPSTREGGGPSGSRESSALDNREQVRGFAPMLLCGLAFAGANQNAEGRVPNVLTAEELSRLNLSGVELAVLSACDTSIGVRRAGLGVASLQGALHAAGARSMLTSLWKVPDRSSAELMQRFYRGLWTLKLTKVEALAQAKKSMREERDGEGRPVYTKRDWAGWVLSGAPD